MNNEIEHDKLVYDSGKDCVDPRLLLTAVGLSTALLLVFPYLGSTEVVAEQQVSLTQITTSFFDYEDESQNHQELAEPEPVEEEFIIEPVPEVVQFSIEALDTPEITVEIPDVAVSKIDLKSVTDLKMDLDFEVESVTTVPQRHAKPAAASKSSSSVSKKRSVKAVDYNAIFNEFNVDKAAVRTSNKAPKYPLLARRRGISGKVVIDCIVTRDGTIAKFKVVESRPEGLFDKSCLAVLDDIRYRPAQKDGRNVSQRTLLTFEFGIQ